jgi:hypothetical protein
MLNFIKVLLIALLLTVFTVFAGDDKSDFSGTWTINEEKSELGEGGRWMQSTKLVITQKDNDLTLERHFKGRDGEDRSMTDKLTLDGKECENPVWGDNIKKSVVTWSDDGKSLTISSTMEFWREGDKTEITTVEIYKLSEDGNVLTSDYSSKSPRGDRKSIYVYDKEKTTG